MFENGAKVRVTSEGISPCLHTDWTGTVINSRNLGTYYLVQSNHLPNETFWIKGDYLELVSKKADPIPDCYAVVDTLGETLGVFINIDKAREFAAVAFFHNNPSRFSLASFDTHISRIVKEFKSSHCESGVFGGFSPAVEKYEGYEIEKIPFFDN